MYEGKYLTTPTGNNAFSYKERSLIYNNPKIWIPGVISSGSLNDLKEGDHIVFEEINHLNQLISCTGLENHLLYSYKNIPIAISDNHNYAFYRRHRAYQNNIFQTPIQCIHIDQHSDMNENKNIISKDSNLKEILDFTDNIINIGNFIIPALNNHLLSEVHQIRTQYTLEEIEKNPPKKPYILDIDIDFRAPELDHINYEYKTKITKNLIENASFITIATSPYFINQKKAIEIIKELLS